jgi:hypothetical protein
MLHHSISHRGLAAVAVAAAMVIVYFAAVASADARTHWYWSETTAEKRLEQRYSHVADANCLGIGYDWRVRHGVEMFRGFYCDIDFIDGSTSSAIVNVTGRRSFRVTRY